MRSTLRYILTVEPPAFARIWEVEGAGYNTQPSSLSKVVLPLTEMWRSERGSVER